MLGRIVIVVSLVVMLCVCVCVYSNIPGIICVTAPVLLRVNLCLLYTFRLPAFKGGNKCPTVARPGGNKDSSSTNGNQVSNLNKTRVQGQSLADRQRSESAQNNNNSLPNSTGKFWKNTLF